MCACVCVSSLRGLISRLNCFVEGYVNIQKCVLKIFEFDFCKGNIIFDCVSIPDIIVCNSHDNNVDTIGIFNFWVLNCLSSSLEVGSYWL